MAPRKKRGKGTRLAKRFRDPKPSERPRRQPTVLDGPDANVVRDALGGPAPEPDSLDDILRGVDDKRRGNRFE